MAIDILGACRSMVARAQTEADPETKRALRVSSRAMLKAVGTALRDDRTSACEVYEAYLAWRADRAAHEIFWTFINVDDCAIREIVERDVTMSRHVAAIAWWEQQLGALRH